ncbi:MAG TPA: hypothetical protein PLA85_10255 [Micropepsaceae bacterium]|nr:hypothetical protein [Micropepsaceae bacterium]
MSDGNESGDEDLPVGQQRAFSDAYVLVHELLNQGVSPKEVGHGILVAALCALRKSMSEKDVAMFLYQYADDYASRHLE